MDFVHIPKTVSSTYCRNEMESEGSDNIAADSGKVISEFSYRLLG